MPPSSRTTRTPPPKGGASFFPPNDTSTYRDLLLFEERLKTNAANLRRRKARYQLFLVQLVLVIIILTSDVLLRTAFLILPVNLVLRRLPIPPRPDIVPHPYVALGALMVAITTLILFYASGTYAEKIGYANRYVPHANKALRSFNMHLNMRAPPLSPPKPFSYLFSRSNLASSSASSSNTSTSKAASSIPRRGAPIPPIPPTTNPRGELIFSSRVDRSFKESYEKYRASFERRREERLGMLASGSGFWAWIRRKSKFGIKDKEKDPGTIGMAEKDRPFKDRGSTRNNSRSSTPASSRASSPVISPPPSAVTNPHQVRRNRNILTRESTSSREENGNEVITQQTGIGLGLSAQLLGEDTDRDRKESFSFLLGTQVDHSGRTGISS